MNNKVTLPILEHAGTIIELPDKQSAIQFPLDLWVAYKEQNDAQSDFLIALLQRQVEALLEHLEYLEHTAILGDQANH